MIPLCMSASWQIEVGELWAATLPEQTSAPAVSRHASCRVSLRPIWMCLVTHWNNGEISRATYFTQTPKKNKNDFFLELSFGNAGPSSQANLYKSMPRSAFKSMSLWMNHGVQKVELPESHWLLADRV